MGTKLLRTAAWVPLLAFFGALSCGPEMMGGEGCGMGGEQKKEEGVCGPGTYWKTQDAKGRAIQPQCAPSSELCGAGTRYNPDKQRCELAR